MEGEEEKMAYRDDQKQCYHLCIVNLVIGTLYCAKVKHAIYSIFSNNCPNYLTLYLDYKG